MAATQRFAQTFGQAGSAAQAATAPIKQYIDTTTQLGQRMAAVTGYSDAAAKSIQGVGSAASEAAGATEKMGVPVATATREFRALFDEFSSGYYHRIPGTLAIIANRVFGLSGTALLATVGIAALAAGIAYLGYQADQADMKMADLAIHAQFAGNAELTKAAVSALTDEVKKLGNTSTDTAEEIVGSWAKIGGMTKTEVEGLSLATVEYMQATGEKAPEAVKLLSRALDDQRLSLKEVLEIFPGLTVAQAEDFQKTQNNGDAHKTAAALIQIMTDKTKQLGPALAEADSHVTASTSNMLQYAFSVARVIATFGLSGVIDKFMGKTDTATAILQKNTERINEQAKASAQASTALGHQAESSDDILKAGLKAGEGIRSTSTEIDALKQKIAAIKAALPIAKGPALGTLKEDLKGANEELAQLEKRQAAPGIRAAKEAGQEAIENARETVSEINANENLGGQQRLAEIRQVWAQLLAGTKLTAQQRIEVEIDMNQSIAEANKLAANQKAEIAKNDASTGLQLAKLGFQQQRDALQEQVAEHLLSKTEELEKLKAIAIAEGQAEIDAVNVEEKAYAQGSVAWEDAENRKKVIAAQTGVELARISNQIAGAENTAAKQSAEYWKRAFSEITSAEDSMIDNILSGHKSLIASLGLALGDFIKKELEADAQYFTAHLFYTQAELAADQTLNQQGLLLHAALETQKTAATAAGTTARTAITASGAAASNAAEATADSTSIMNSAYTSAAAAYKSVMQALPPPVNLILAPIAAAGTFAAVAAYNTITKLETGAWEVPKIMPALLHPGEQVVPKNYADGLRSAGGGGNRGGGGMGDVHVHYMPQINAPESKSLSAHLAKDSSLMRSWFQAQVRDGFIKPESFAGAR
jgi:hypothetical protein